MRISAQLFLSVFLCIALLSTTLTRAELSVEEKDAIKRKTNHRLKDILKFAGVTFDEDTITDEELKKLVKEHDAISKYAKAKLKERKTKTKNPKRLEEKKEAALKRLAKRGFAESDGMTLEELEATEEVLDQKDTDRLKETKQEL